MRQLPIGAPVRITEDGPDWARNATGTVTIDLGDSTYLVEFDEPLNDGSGDGPYTAVPFGRAVLTTDLTGQR
jgi:hypothetical protein